MKDTRVPICTWGPDGLRVETWPPCPSNFCGVACDVEGGPHVEHGGVAARPSPSVVVGRLVWRDGEFGTWRWDPPAPAPPSCCPFHASGGHPDDRHGLDPADRVYGLTGHEAATCDQCKRGHAAICVARRIGEKDERARCVDVVKRWAGEVDVPTPAVDLLIHRLRSPGLDKLPGEGASS